MVTRINNASVIDCFVTLFRPVGTVPRNDGTFKKNNRMKEVVSELTQIVDDFVLKINKISDEEFSAKPLPNKWSKKEVLGHLIDSALNNHRRFVCGQYEPTPPKIRYDQDFWAKANDYQNSKKEDVILLWKLINKK